MVTKASNSVLNLAYPPITIGAFEELVLPNINDPLLGAPGGTVTGVPYSAVWRNHGECYLQFIDTGLIALVPRNGCGIMSGGVNYQLPGITYAASNNIQIAGVAEQAMVPNGTYWVSYNGSQGTLNLWGSGTFSHAPDSTAGNIGIEVITLTSTAVHYTNQ